MRFLVGCLLLASIAPAVRAKATAPDAATVQRWIEWLGDPNPSRRRVAYYRLAEAGETVVDALMAVKTENPDILRSVRRLTRAARKIVLTMRGPTKPHPVGVTLELKLRLDNDTDDPYVLPFQEQRRGNTLRSCFVVFAGRREFRLLPHHVRGLGPQLRLKPGEIKEFTVRFEAATGFVKGPGRTKIRWRYTAQRAVVGSDGETAPVTLDSGPIFIRAIVRTPDQLRRALDGGREERESAIAELSARSDAAILPLFRERFRDPDIAPLAVAAFGAAGKEEDLAILLPATTKHPSRQVRLAAVRALGKYPQSGKARRRLTRLVLDHDEELLDAAADALAGHKHARTVAVYIDLLRRRGPWQRKIVIRLRRWTGMPISARKSEIDAFELWFMRQRKLGRPWALSDRRK